MQKRVACSLLPSLLTEPHQKSSLPSTPYTSRVVQLPTGRLVTPRCTRTLLLPIPLTQSGPSAALGQSCKRMLHPVFLRCICPGTFDAVASLQVSKLESCIWMDVCICPGSFNAVVPLQCSRLKSCNWMNGAVNLALLQQCLCCILISFQSLSSRARLSQ